MVNIFKNMDNSFVGEVDKTIEKWHLSKKDKQGFLNLRQYYNEHLGTMTDRDNAIILYCLLTHSFNNQIAFNSKGEYNMASGIGKSYFNPQLREKLKRYIEVKNQRDILFLAKDFLDIDMCSLCKPEDTFVYVDPPYLITDGVHNSRDYFCRWSIDYENKLLAYLDTLDKADCKWALSNVIEHKGKSNDILKMWCKKYNIHYLNMSYGNCNYQTKDKSADSSVEVLITNY